MIYAVSHRTTYSYAESVDLSHHVLRLRPRLLPYQRVVRANLIATPMPARSTDVIDHFGNIATYLTVEEPHERLVIEERSVVEVGFPPAPPAAAVADWESVRDLLSNGLSPELIEASEFTFESPLVPLLPEVAGYGAASFPPGRSLIEAARDLTQRIHHDFVFDPTATAVSTPLAEVMRQRRGVCQDFAHVEIAALRSLGLAARYVSGYIRTHRRDGARTIGADASHAWVSVFCPDHGWVDFDPTNNLVVDDQHVVVAWGRDYADVSPIRGVILGGGHHSLDVAVELIPVS